MENMENDNLVQNAEIVKKMESFLESCEKTKGAYFWHSQSTASGRRYCEKKYSDNLDIEFVVSKKSESYFVKITADLTMNYSCKHVYRSVSVKINDVKTNITLLKSFIAILKNEKKLTANMIKKFTLLKKVELTEGTLFL